MLFLFFFLLYFVVYTYGDSDVSMPGGFRRHLVGGSKTLRDVCYCDLT